MLEQKSIQSGLLEGKTALVTGASRGLGRAIALALGMTGASVAVTDLLIEGSKYNAKSLSEYSPLAGHFSQTGEVKTLQTTHEIQAMGTKSCAMKLDVTDLEDIKRIVQAVESQLGPIDILVNNAGGVSGDAKIEDTTEEAWDRVIDVNLKGQFLCCRAVIPYMKKNKYGKIINISSMGAIHPPAPIVHYHSAKGGVLGLTANLALELARLNITVNAILPGPIRSEFFTEMLKGMSEEEGKAFFQMLDNKVPMHRMGTPEEVAGVALFLASELSSYVTGEAINVGGGLPLSPLDVN